MTTAAGPTVVGSPSELLSLGGADLGVTDWVPVTQARVDLFADATGGAAVGHDYLTLSLVNLFLPQLLEVRGASMGVNVGLDEVRFPVPAPTGSNLRGRGEIVAVDEAKGGVQVTVRVTVEIEGRTEPACVADTVSRFFP